jgi:transcriptional regulator with XRE-family HTH domain
MRDIDLCIPRPIWSDMLLTPEQCRAGRALLTWTQDDLATRAEVSRSTVRGFENGQHELHRASAAAIRRALEEGGIVFIDADTEHGPGVRMADRTKGLPSG